MQQSTQQLSYQVTAMKRRLEEIPQTIGGAYNRKYYSLKAKIKNTQALLDKLNWQEFLAK